jgi:hypothetical protein
MRRVRLLTVGALVGAAALAMQGTAGATAGTAPPPPTIASWTMPASTSGQLVETVSGGPGATFGTSDTLCNTSNESSSTCDNFPGVPAITYPGFEYESFPEVQRGFNNATFDPNHLDVVCPTTNPSLCPNGVTSEMNPGTSTFIVTVRLLIRKQSDSFGNIMQKGQTGSPTGFWKIQLDGGGGYVFCGFRSIVGGVTTNGGVRDKINSTAYLANNQWHDVTCERGYTMVNGQWTTFVSTTVCSVFGTVTCTTARQMQPVGQMVGDITNNVPLTIGGKANCTAATQDHDCDYFVGDLATVMIQSAPAPAGA